MVTVQELVGAPVGHPDRASLLDRFREECLAEQRAFVRRLGEFSLPSLVAYGIAQHHLSASRTPYLQAAADMTPFVVEMVASARLSSIRPPLQGREPTVQEWAGIDRAAQSAVARWVAALYDDDILSRRAQVRSMCIRSATYANVEEDVLRELFQTAAVERHLPATVNTIVGVCEAVGLLTLRRQQAASTMMRSVANQVFAAADVAALGEFPLADVRTVLEFMSVAASECAEHPFESYLDGSHPLRRRSLIKLGDDEFVSVGGGDLISRIRPLLEELLSGRPAWNVYERNRSRYTESIALTNLRRILSPSQEFQSLHYDSVGEDPKHCEIDLVMVVDDTVFAIEVKGGSLREDAKRGLGRRTYKGLAKLVREGSVQAERFIGAAESARSSASGVLRGRMRGANVEFDMRGIKRFIPIVLTLEDLNGLANSLLLLAEHDLVVNRDRLPVVLSLHDLGIAADLWSGPADLLYYAIGRERISKWEVIAQDERDLLLYDFHFGWEWVDRSEHPVGEAFVFNSLTDELDAHYGAKHFGHPPAPLPRRDTSRRAEKRLRDLDRHRDSGFLGLSLEVLSRAYAATSPHETSDAEFRASLALPPRTP